MSDGGRCGRDQARRLQPAWQQGQSVALNGDARWVFGYGSLIFRPGFEASAQRHAVAHGWARRFWQASHDHRGRPGAPGRVVTLVPLAGERCEGVAWLLPTGEHGRILDALDHRERDGYRRVDITLTSMEGVHFNAITWIAAPDNPSWVGPAGETSVVETIATASGESGANRDYLFGLASTLRSLGIDDPHVEQLAQRVRDRVGPGRPSWTG